jgi:hypothetical protein
MSKRILAPTVPVISAEDGTEYWRQFYEFFTKVDNSQIFRGFHIPAADLRTLLTEVDEDIDAVRAYFALENPFDSDKPDAANNIHIYLVPVKDNVDIVEDRDGNSNVCDFTTPCPKICDTSSVLYDLPTTRKK